MTHYSKQKISTVQVYSPVKTTNRYVDTYRPGHDDTLHSDRYATVDNQMLILSIWVGKKIADYRWYYKSKYSPGLYFNLFTLL